MKKLSNETRDFLLTLIKNELDAEKDYQSGNCDYNGNKDEHSLDYVKSLINAQKELLLQDNTGIMPLINAEVLNESLSKFNLQKVDIN